MTTAIGQKMQGRVRFLRSPEVRACRGARSMSGGTRGASPGGSRWELVQSAGSTRRYASG